MELITSSRNQHIKELKSLKVKKNREAVGMFYIEGLRFVEESIDSDANINKLILSQTFINSNKMPRIMNSLDKRNIITITDKLMKEVSDTENPQGIIAVIKMKRYTLNDILTTDNGLIIILDSIQDPGNLGTIVRTADAAGATGIIISKGCVDLYNTKVLRSTMGSIFHLPIYLSDDYENDLKAIRKLDFNIYSTHLSAENSCYEIDYNGPTAIIIGNEANGISEESKRYSTKLVKIPMPGKAESLNASAASAIMIYEAVRQRTKFKQ